ncbi:M14 family zinc carboxypeptidase [Litchfieldia alkalitelluris]|uniref:M14 family zinc carboxypeptidase n=1 Tax=Litchfieldia alkalitelluris TaxID=304268 RepID=UPI0014765916|nr:M14 family zinc carboxypeptidase [Litchfieldia alkalitelluris]
MLRFISVIGCCLFLLSHVAFADDNGEYTYEKMMNETNIVKKNHPEIIEVTSIGTSPFGRDIPAIKLGKGKKHVLFVGSHHGREWMTTQLLMKMIHTYATAYERNEKVGNYHPEILDEVSIWFVPMINPDGVTIQQNGINMFSIGYQQLLLEMNHNQLNLQRWKANGLGVDLNRQYPAGWEEIKGAQEHAAYRYYKGQSPLEAEEVRSLVKFIIEEDPVISIAYHSSGRVIFWHYKNDQQVVKRDFEIANEISKLTGYDLAKPPKKATGGGLTDWFITRFKRPAYTIEISYEVKEQAPPLSVFPEEWKRNKEIGLMIAEQAKNIN